MNLVGEGSLRRGGWVISFVVVTCAVWFTYGAGAVGYDAAYAVLWGSELTDGQQPSFEAHFAPTPHPLTIAEGAVASMFGGRAYGAMAWMGTLVFAALILSSFAFARTLFTWQIGFAAAALVATTPLYVAASLQVVTDPQFVLFLLLAGVFAYGDERGERPRLAALMICLAGLLRPEAWAIGALYVGILASRRGMSRSLVEVAMLVAAGPLIWLSLDAAVTGDPLHSLHGTQALAEDLGRYRGTSTALRAAPAYLREILGTTLLACGLVGVAIGLRWWSRASEWLGTLLALGLAAFVALGIVGLPLIVRYLGVPATILIVFGAVLLAGWISLPAGTSERKALTALAAVGLLALIATSPGRVTEIQEAQARAAAVGQINRDSRALASAIDLRGACDPFWFSGFNTAPQFALVLKKRAETFAPVKPKPPAHGTVIAWPSEQLDAQLRAAGFTRIESSSRLAGWAKCGSD